MTIIVIQLVILAVMLLVPKLVRVFSRANRKKRVKTIALLPFVLTYFIWQLTRAWAFPWLATVIIGWMSLCIFATIYLAVSRGEILWRQFLTIFNRLSCRYLFLGYVITLSITVWLIR